MPCRWSRRCGSSEQTTEVNEDGVKVQNWHSVRRQNMRRLRKNTRHIVLLMALIEAMRIGPVQIVYAGKQGYPAPGPEDFGIAYNVGYFVSWLYVCLFMIVFVPLFSWWIPNTSADDSKSSMMSRTVEFLKSLNLILLPFTVGVCLVSHFYYTIMTLIYVDARPAGTYTLPANTKKNWIVRFMLVAGVVMSMSFGYGAFQILEAMDLAHVKKVEYLVIVLPIQTNLGLLFGSVAQWKMEKRIERKRLAALADKAEEEAATVAVVDEKSALTDV